MDQNRNYNTDEQCLGPPRRNNENADEQPETQEINNLDHCVVSTFEEKDDTSFHRLYASIVRGDKDMYIKILEEIRKNEINLDERYFDGEYVADIHKTLTALQLVCVKGDKQMLLELLELDINVNNCGEYGKTPLNIACLHCNVDLVKLLISKGADLNAHNTQDDCDTALITTVACYQPELENADTYLQIGKLLLDAGACCNKTDKIGQSAIHSAVTKSDDRYTELLLNHNASPNLVCAKYMSPLCKAIDTECYHNAKVLLKYGCQVNEKNDENQLSLVLTPLHIAVSKNNLEMIRTLLEAGADPNSYSKRVAESVYQHSSVLHLAASEDQLLTLWLLVVKGGDINSQHDLRRDTPLLILARKGSVEGVKMLLRFGADVELESQVGTTPVWVAVRENYLQVLHLLLETCCSLEIPSMEYHMYMPLTPLEIALRLQSWNMALILLNAGANHKTSTLNDAIPAPVPLRGHRIIRTRAAYRLSPEDHQALKELRMWKSQPKTLRHTCRAILRSHFTRHLPKLLEKLNYPIRLQNYLYMKE